MRKFIAITLIIGFFSTNALNKINAQLFNEMEIFPRTKKIIGRYYNGCSKYYWTKSYLDSKGRIYKKESYKKFHLLSRTENQFDNHNNKILTIQTNKINKTKTKDTTWYKYKYKDDRIIYQYLSLYAQDSTVIELKENICDSILLYIEKSYSTSANNKIIINETKLLLKYRKGLLILKEKYYQDSLKDLIKYEYFENKKLKRRIIERIPELKIKGNYIGGPGSDDEAYEYVLDSKGREKKFTKIIDGKKYKIAKYKYY